MSLLQHLGNKVLVFDGAIGTNLPALGLNPGESPELFGLRKPEAIKSLHLAYRRAGADIISTNTFGGNRFKLGTNANVVDVNRQLTEIARHICNAEGGRRSYVAGSVSPTGEILLGVDSITIQKIIDAYREQIRGLVLGGADLILCETFFDLTELRLAVIAARLESDLPIITSMTFEGDVSLTGTSPEVFAETMINMGVNAIGVNCGSGPDQTRNIVERLAAVSCVPILAKPNAGLPHLQDGRTIYDLGVSEFAEQTSTFIEIGAHLVGGCCGTTPAHIAALSTAVSCLVPKKPISSNYVVLSSRSQLVRIGPGLPTALIGECINPTKRKKLSAQLPNGDLSEVLRLADEQIRFGAPILDVNVGAPDVDEESILPLAVSSLVNRFEIPLSIDSTNAEAVRKALTIYPASPLVNSINGEPGHLELLGPLCKLYGAPFVLLPITGGSLPTNTRDRLTVIEALVQKALDMGIDKRLIVVDVLALTVSAQSDAARQCLETIRYCTEDLKLATVLGLSNISFGLPARELLNSNFLAMGMTAGLTACIANPGSSRIREAMASAEILLGRDHQATRFVSDYSNWKPGENTVSGSSITSAIPTTINEAIIQGATNHILALVEAEISKERDPLKLSKQELAPAIIEVCEKFGRKEFFLPQLIRSAETMQKALEYLKPLLEANGQTNCPGIVVMAAVEGDVHDIGKNIVCLLLRNHDFVVHDLGKSVTAEFIVNEAERLGANIIGLSALMTTTMVHMKEVVDLVKQRGLAIKIIVGGAVLTESYANSIGADGYAADAVSAVHLAIKLTANVAKND